jgi:hypothetical protein
MLYHLISLHTHTNTQNIPYIYQCCVAAITYVYHSQSYLKHFSSPSVLRSTSKRQQVNHTFSCLKFLSKKENWRNALQFRLLLCHLCRADSCMLGRRYHTAREAIDTNRLLVQSILNTLNTRTTTVSQIEKSTERNAADESDI